MPQTLLIRADASARIGTGHIMRMIALAQACQQCGFDIFFASIQCPSPIVERIEEEGFSHHALNAVPLGSHEDREQSLQLARRLSATWMILDGYHFDESYQRFLKEEKMPVLAVDDYGHCKQWWSCAMLNQNLGAQDWSKGQSACHDTTFFLGSSFTLLRKEFLKSIAQASPTLMPLRKILITLGGGDADNVTLKVLESLSFLADDSLELRVLAGGGNPHYQSLLDFAQKSPQKIELLDNVRDMPSMFAWADGVISAGGSTCWEWLSYGLPGVVITIADNQLPLQRELSLARLALCLGWHSEGSTRQWADTLSAWIKGSDNQLGFEAKRKIFDGQGAARIASFLSKKKLFVREARLEDAHQLWLWANNPEVRASSYNQAPIPWEDHLAWIKKRMASPLCFLFIIENLQAQPIGQARFDWLEEPGAWLIDYSLDQTMRGKGLGTDLLLTATEQLVCMLKKTSQSTPLLHAFVKKDNLASVKVFERLGYKSQVANTHSFLFTKTY